ncbi:MAG: hypothetical protein L7V85_01120 [Bacteroidia bacterium]|nr:hypothetical protein [Bacteroidia bacterium]
MRWIIVSLVIYWVIKRVFRIINVVQNQNSNQSQNTKQSNDNDDGFTDFEEVE